MYKIVYTFMSLYIVIHKIGCFSTYLSTMYMILYTNSLILSGKNSGLFYL